MIRAVAVAELMFGSILTPVGGIRQDGSIHNAEENGSAHCLLPGEVVKRYALET
jgi:hypothetical protein